LAKHYPLTLNHKIRSPCDLAKDAEQFLKADGEKILARLLPANESERERALSDAGGCEAIIDELGSILLESIAQVLAAPNRPVRALMDALNAIKRNPKLLMDRHDELEPEAANLLANEYISLSETHRREWLEFERTPGAPLDENAVQTAAEQACRKFSMQLRRGPTTDPAQRNLAIALGRFFLKFNSSIGRVVTGEGVEGRFKEFLETVLPFYRQAGKPVDRGATTDWMVRVAAQALSRDHKGTGGTIPN
jgi:hypothetical protein